VELGRVVKRAAVTGALAGLLLGFGPAEAGIVYTALQDGTWVLHYQADPGAPPRAIRQDLGLDASAPALSPDGKQVAFETPGQGILICPLEGTAECRPVKPGSGSAVRPAWNPMNGELVFARYVVDARGEESDLVTQTGPLLLQTGNQDEPDVSPDGRLLVYSSAQTIGMHRAGVQVVRQLWILDLGSGVARQVLAGNSQDIHPDWSPSGDEIAFASDREGTFDIWIVKLDGTGLRRVTSGPGAKTWPAWSPDGKTILYSVTRDGRQELEMIDSDGKNPRPFRPFGDGSDVQLRDADWR
jgi:TolB protein